MGASCEHTHINQCRHRSVSEHHMGFDIMDSWIRRWFHARWSTFGHFWTTVVLYMLIYPRFDWKYHWSQCSEHQYAHCAFYEGLFNIACGLTYERPLIRSTVSPQLVNFLSISSLESLCQTRSVDRLTHSFFLPPSRSLSSVLPWLGLSTRILRFSGDGRTFLVLLSILWPYYCTFSSTTHRPT